VYQHSLRGVGPTGRRLIGAKALSSHIEVPEKGEVEIRGFADSHEEKAQILKTIKALRGVSKIHDDIGIIPYRP